MSFGRFPTPLEHAPRIGARIGVELWLKREDQSDTFLCGNKARKLAALLPHAVAQGADTLVVAGSAQSNLCRVTTLAAAALGMRTEILVGVEAASTPPPIAGNLLLSVLAGAKIRWVEFAALLRDAKGLLDARAAALSSEGKKPFVIAFGANTPDALRNVSLIADEIVDALPDGDFTLVCPVASGGTFASLLHGLERRRPGTRALGVVITERHEMQGTAERIARFYEQASGSPLRDSSYELVDGSGVGYSKSTPEELELLASLARDGLLLDETYNVKAMGALLRKGKSLGPRVVYVVTGGHFSLFALGAPLADAAQRHA